MARTYTAQASSLWHSRSKLAASSIVLVILIALIDQRRQSLPEIPDTHIETTTHKADDLLEDVDYAMETIEYMAKLPTGKSFVRGVWEKEHQFNEYYWWCPVWKPRNVKNKGWIQNDGLYLFSAYYDNRSNSLFPRNDAVQVISMSYRTLENRTAVYCTLTSGNDIAHVEGYVREIWQRAWDPRDHFYVPNLITCPVPERLKNAAELTISLTTKRCRSQNTALQVRMPEIPKERKYVAVCVKGMDFQKDLSTRLVEWIEAQLLFGADNITIYKYSLSNATQKVLDFYEGTGKLEQLLFSISLELPGNSPNIPHIRSDYIWRNRQQKRKHELIPYNDCLYRHLYSHRYILILDTDEVVVPLRSTSFKALLSEFESNHSKIKLSSISVRNVFKFPSKSPAVDVPEFMYFLRNNKRSKETSPLGEYGKSFTSTAHVATVFNHFALHRLEKNISGTQYFHEKKAVKLHYKEKCPIESKKKCPELETDLIDDHSLDGVERKLKENVEKSLKEIGIL